MFKNLFKRKDSQLKNARMAESAVEGNFRNVSWEEFSQLIERFDALCDHLGVRVQKQYRPTVIKTSTPTGNYEDRAETAG